MASANERRQEHTPDQEFAGLAARSLREGVPVDELELRLKNRDESVGPDAERVEGLRDGAKSKLLAMAGYTTEKAAAELQPIVVEKPALEAAQQDAVFEASEGRFTLSEQTMLFSAIEDRFTSQPERYNGIQWSGVKRALEAADKSVIAGLIKMEENGHEVGVTPEEKGGKKGFRFDSCSKSSPVGIRDVDYAQAETVAKGWNVDLMGDDVFEKLRKAGIITESGTWSHLKTDEKTLKGGLSWYGFDNGVNKYNANAHDLNGGFRCSLWVPEV